MPSTTDTNSLLPRRLLRLRRIQAGCIRYARVMKEMRDTSLARDAGSTVPTVACSPLCTPSRPACVALWPSPPPLHASIRPCVAARRSRGLDEVPLRLLDGNLQLPTPARLFTTANKQSTVEGTCLASARDAEPAGRRASYCSRASDPVGVFLGGQAVPGPSSCSTPLGPSATAAQSVPALLHENAGPNQPAHPHATPPTPLVAQRSKRSRDAPGGESRVVHCRLSLYGSWLAKTTTTPHIPARF